MLSKELAQNIVDKMMQVIPYNVNIMNEKGVIVGSGDYYRVGSLHCGAVEALHLRKTIEVINENTDIKPGVNIPIYFKERVIGVIGITGNPEQVRAFGEIVRVTAELLINQEYSLNQYIIKSKLKEEFIYEWLYSNNEYDNEFKDRGKALEIDVTGNKIVIIIEYKKETSDKIRKYINKVIKQNEYYLNISTNRIAVIINDDINKKKRIQDLESKFNEAIIRLGIGRNSKILNNSLLEAIESINIANSLFEYRKIVRYEEIEFFYKMQELFKSNNNNNIINSIKLSSKGNELIDTFITFMDLNGERNKIAQNLHIHRNTLNYRLEKIEEVTNLKFDNILDFYKLSTAYISYKLFCANEQNNS
ncbi:sugar diacid recognition domain-containing protein [Clostridium carnis]